MNKIKYTISILKIIIVMLCYIVLAISAACMWIFPKKKSVKFLTFFTLLWGIIGRKILGVKLTIHGDVKKVSGLIISNHTSYLDIIVIASLFKIRFAAKSDLAKWPILGWIISVSRPVFVNRRSRQASIKTMNEFKWTLLNNVSLVAFPEGTTTDGKCALVSFKSTSFESAIQSESKISPILIHYKDPHASWALEDTTPLLTHALRLFSKLKIEAEIYILDPIPATKKSDRKLFCNIVYKIMNDKYREIRN